MVSSSLFSVWPVRIISCSSSYCCCAASWTKKSKSDLSFNSAGSLSPNDCTWARLLRKNRLERSLKYIWSGMLSIRAAMRYCSRNSSSSTCLRWVMSRKDQTLPMDLPRMDMGFEMRSKIRPSFRLTRSILSSSGCAYKSVTFDMNSSGSTSCVTAYASRILSCFEAITSAGICHNSANLALVLRTTPS